MKRKKTLNKLIILLTLLTPTIVSAEEYVAKEYIVCGNNKKFPTVIGTLISTVYIIIRILVPLLLVISGIVSFFKVTFSGNVEDSLDKSKKKLVTNIIAAIVIFFIASIINFVVGLAVGNENNFKSCMYCMLHPTECKQEDSDVATLCPGLLSDQDKYNPDCTLKDPDQKGERIDHSDTGDTKIPAYAATTAKAGGGAIARSLRDNPNSTGSEYFKKNTYSGYSYYLYTPKQIDNDKAALIVYLHGSGGEGTTEAPLREDGGGGFFHEIEQNKKEYNAYILIIQTPIHAWHPNDIVMTITNEIVKNNNIDEKRISLWGYSLGANAATNIIGLNSNYFSSAVILSSQIDQSMVNNVKKSFATTPTYILHGDADKDAHGSQKLYNALYSEHYKVYKKVYTNQGHPLLPNRVLEDTELDQNYNTIMDWVLDQRRTD